MFGPQAEMVSATAHSMIARIVLINDTLGKDSPSGSWPKGLRPASDQRPSLRLTSSFTAAGLALPPVDFMT